VYYDGDVHRSLLVSIGLSGCFTVTVDDVIGSACVDTCPGDLVCREGTCGAELLAHWSFEENPLPTDGFVDESGHGHTLLCDPCKDIWNSGAARGNGYGRVGDPCLRVPAHDDFAAAPFTIMVSIPRPASLTAIPTGSIMAKPASATTSAGNSWQLEVTGDVISFSGGTANVTAAFPANGGQWIDLAGTWDGTTKQLFVDGTRSGSTPAEISFDETPIVVGCDLRGGVEVLTYDAEGIDEVLIYRGVLTVAEIQAWSALTQ
jgi:hypothetical protein